MGPPPAPPLGLHRVDVEAERRRRHAGGAAADQSAPPTPPRSRPGHPQRGPTRAWHRLAPGAWHPRPSGTEPTRRSHSPVPRRRGLDAKPWPAASRARATTSTCPLGQAQGGEVEVGAVRRIEQTGERPSPPPDRSARRPRHSRKPSRNSTAMVASLALAAPAEAEEDDEVARQSVVAHRHGHDMGQAAARRQVHRSRTGGPLPGGRAGGTVELRKVTTRWRPHRPARLQGSCYGDRAGARRSGIAHAR